jgi:uncharacterized membrane protein YhhN
MIHYIFLIFFFIGITVNIFSVAKKNKKWEYISKPLLMPLLAAYFILVTYPTSVAWLIFVALLCGGVGDIFLMLENKFMQGMSAFLLGHIFYIVAFLLLVNNILTFPIWGFFLFVPVIVILLLIYPKFKDFLGDLRIPVHIYLVTILLMHIFAILLLAELSILSPSFLFIWLGSFLFILSDSLIAVDKFNENLKIPNVAIIIMITYIIGQFLITQGMLLAILL